MEIFPSQIIFTFYCQNTAPLTEHAILGFVFRSWNLSAHDLNSNQQCRNVICAAECLSLYI